MRHIFSSGEIFYQGNVKDLAEGKLVANCIVYEDIRENMEFTTLGTIDGKQVRVRFKLEPEGEKKILFKHSIRILMQSDIFHENWNKYQLEWITGL